MIILGIAILLILALLIIVLLNLIDFNKRQDGFHKLQEQFIEDIGGFSHNTILMHKESAEAKDKILNQIVILESKQMSISDGVKDIAKGLHDAHTKTMNALAPKKTQNKPRRRDNNKNGTNTLDRNNSSIGSR